MHANDADTNNSPSQNNNNAGSYSEYLKLAAQSCAAGNVVLGLHLYLAAYEKSVQDSCVPDPEVIEGLRQAWIYTCSHKERSLAEYIFEKLEPYLSSEEVTQYATQLQRLALDKLEEFGLSREDLEDMTDLISQDFFGADPSTFFMRIENGMPLTGMFGPSYKGLTRDHTLDAAGAEVPENKQSDSRDSSQLLKGGTAAVSTEDSDCDKSALEKETSDLSADIAQDSAGAELSHSEGAKADAQSPQSLPSAGKAASDTGQAQDLTAPSRPSGEAKLDSKPLKPVGTSNPLDAGSAQLVFPSFVASGQEQAKKSLDRISYRDLVGYESAIKAMHTFGIGVRDDPDFKEFIETLNKQYGLSKIPATDTFLLRSPAREDANQFMVATMNEIGLPAIRMRMEENLQGLPVLCVMASHDHQPKMNTTHAIFEGGGILVLEDIDLWGAPLLETGSEDLSGFIYAHLSRGAREAINLVRSAVENPDVYVFVSASNETTIDPFFLDLLEPLLPVDIELPTASEREDLWVNIAKEHPPLKAIDHSELVKYSAGMSRFDIYMAAREAVEEAYKASLLAREYLPLSIEIVFEKIAAYQPLDSDEYQQLENAVVENFKTELEQLDDLLKGTSE